MLMLAVIDHLGFYAAVIKMRCETVNELFSLSLSLQTVILYQLLQQRFSSSHISQMFEKGHFCSMECKGTVTGALHYSG